MKKRIMSILIVAAIVLMLLSACSSDSGGTSSSTGGSTSDSSSSSSAGSSGGDSTSPGGEPETVVYWIQKFEDWNMEYFQAQTDIYNTLGRGYIADVSFVPGDVWDDQLTAAVASGTAPDGYTISYNNILSAVTRGQLMPLNDLFPQSAIDDIYDNVRGMVTFNGSLYAYPQLVEPSALLYYRTDLFAEAGITAPPKTWDEMIEVGKQLSTADIYGLEIGEFGAFGWNTWGAQYAASGHLAINDDWDTPLIDDGYRALADYIKRLYDEKVVPEQNLSAYVDIMPFGTGQVAMKICGSWGIAGIMNDFPEVADKFAVAPIPTRDGNQDKPTATNGGWTFTIDARARNAKGAADYIGYLLAEDPAVPAEFFAIANYAKSAPRKSVDDYIAANVSPEDAPWAAGVAYVASRAIPEPKYPWDISAAVALMFESVAIGGVSMDNAVNDCIATINEVIQNQNIAGTNPDIN